MVFENWDDAMFWYGCLIGYTAGVKSACKDEDKSSLLLRMADTQVKVELLESENATLRERCADLYAEMITYSKAPNYNASVWAPKLREVEVEVNYK